MSDQEKDVPAGAQLVLWIGIFVFGANMNVAYASGCETGWGLGGLSTWQVVFFVLFFAMFMQTRRAKT